MEGPVLRVSGREGLGEALFSRHVFAASTGQPVSPLVDTTGPAPRPSAPADVAPRVVTASSRPVRRAPTSVPACIFCERPSGSAEYAWPEWLCGFLTEQLIVWNKDRGTDAAILERTRTEVDQMVTGVCGHCSQGWMQRLDNNVSPFLQSMIVGDPTPLPQVRRRLLARWAAKTAVVMECADESPIRTPRFASDYLRRIGVHPGTQVLVGKYEGDRQILTHERDLFSRVIDTKKHYLSQSSFVIGKTLIQVFSDPWRDSTPELAEIAAQPLIALVPAHDRQTDWPPSIAIDDVGYDIVRHGSVDEDERTRQLSAPSDPAA